MVAQALGKGQPRHCPEPCSLGFPQVNRVEVSTAHCTDRGPSALEPFSLVPTFICPSVDTAFILDVSVETGEDNLSKCYPRSLLVLTRAGAVHASLSSQSPDSLLISLCLFKKTNSIVLLRWREQWKDGQIHK